MVTEAVRCSSCTWHHQSPGACSHDPALLQSSTLCNAWRHDWNRTKLLRSCIRYHKPYTSPFRVCLCLTLCAVDTRMKPQLLNGLQAQISRELPRHKLATGVSHSGPRLVDPELRHRQGQGLTGNDPTRPLADRRSTCCKCRFSYFFSPVPLAVGATGMGALAVNIWSRPQHSFPCHAVSCCRHPNPCSPCPSSLAIPRCATFANSEAISITTPLTFQPVKKTVALITPRVQSQDRPRASLALQLSCP